MKLRPCVKAALETVLLNLLVVVEVAIEMRNLFVGESAMFEAVGENDLSGGFLVHLLVGSLFILEPNASYPQSLFL